MGLDVYLYHCPNRAKAKKQEAAFEKATEGLWAEVCGDDYDKLPEAEKDKLYKKYEKQKKEIAKKFDCTGKYEQHKDVEKIELDSKIDPKHYFKIGYFRSSYNGGGFDAVMDRKGLPTLYKLFDVNDEYEVKPNWSAALRRVNAAIKQLEALEGDPMGDIDVMEVAFNPFIGMEKLPTEASQVLTEVKKQLSKDSGFDGGSYSNGYGFFFPKGVEVVACVPGIQRILGEVPCMYVAFRKKKEEGTTEDWYLTALRIVKETIEYVMGQSDPENYYFHWSG